MINSATIAGRLTKDPELRYTQSGTAVLSFTLASERIFKIKMVKGIVISSNARPGKKQRKSLPII